MSAFFVCASVFGIMIGNKAIVAQIQNIYNERSDEIAGLNALMSAVAANDVSGVRFFSKGGKSLINQKNIGGATPLHIASREGNLEIVTILIENGAEVNVSDNEGWTSLMRASLSNSPEIVDLLLTKGADATLVNSVGESALIHATSSDCDECLNAMFEKFNFIKLMDEKLLKDQINDAFITARNHENKTAQNLLEKYLDQAIKMALLNNQADPADPISIVEDNKLNVISQSNSAAVQNNKLSEQNLPIAPEILRQKQIDQIKSKFRFVASDPIDPTDAMASSTQTTAPTEQTKIESVILPTVQILRKNKFILNSSGPKGEVREEKKIPEKEFKPNDSSAVFLLNSKIDNKPALQSKKFKFAQGPVASAEVKPEVVKQNSFSAPPPAPVVPPVVTPTLFKFTKGPAKELVAEVDKKTKTAEEVRANPPASAAPPVVTPTLFKFTKGPAKEPELIKQNSSLAPDPVPFPIIPTLFKFTQGTTKEPVEEVRAKASAEDSAPIPKIVPIISSKKGFRFSQGPSSQ